MAFLEPLALKLTRKHNFILVSETRPNFVDLC